MKTKRLGILNLILGVALLVGAGSAPAQTAAWSPVTTALNAVTATTTSSAINTAGATSACVHFISASTSTATPEVLIGLDGTSYASAITASNPDTAGNLLCGPVGRSLKAKVTRSGGTISAYVVTRTLANDPLAVGGWRSIAVGSNSFGALAVTSLTNSGLTSGRVPYSTTGGLQTDSSAFTISSGALTLGTSVTAPLLIGAQQDTVSAKGSNGAISSAPGTILITKGTALGSSTLATPTVTTHDGYILRIVSTTAAAHVISCASGKVNGGTTTTLTFGGAIGDGIVLVAYQGVWYVVHNINVTLS